MAFLVLEEKSFSTAMLFSSAPAFFASSSLRRMRLEKGWGGSGVASGVSLVSNWNHLGSICGVPTPCLHCNRSTWDPQTRIELSEKCRGMT